ncbi:MULTISPECIES: DMT family transporter [Thioclava]|uniref:DMT family transporter n=2 Tax=Thioclava TaxID=285107 RepID=A0ABX6YYK2_9RHOB|nr:MULTISPECIES: DMT family transporter [Thioclava]OOY08286.1 EamA family transporter [Thioclava sp. F36-7]OOY18982.1 EamA family transporter [Thioclava sp. DLFJ5-1]OOY32114.1 EamA family transporter [Thioclava sp. F36-6]QPZ92806.1 DMT family transporter [Thioclava electrotropha]
MDLRAIGMGLAFALMWSSAFTSTHIIVAEAPPLAALALRFALSGGIGIALALAFGQSWRLSRAQWRATIIFGICQNALYLGFNWVAMTTVEASVAAIIASTMPLIVGALGWIVFRDRIPPLGIAGLVAGFAGVGIIMGARLQGGIDPFGLGLCVAGALALAVATLTVRGASGGGGGVLMIVGLQMLVGAVSLAVVSAFTEHLSVEVTPTLAFAFTYTVIVPGLMATWVWFRLVGRIGAVRAATFHFLTPVFGVAIAWAVLGEHVDWHDALGVLVIAGGILAVQISKQEARR